MFSDRLLEGYSRASTYTGWFGCYPFRIDQTRGKFYVDFWSHFRTIHVWSWFTAYLFIVLPTHLYNLYVTNQINAFNYTVLVLCGCCICSILLGVLSFRADGWCQIVNAFIKFFIDFSVKHMPKYNLNQDSQNKKLEAFLVIFYVLVGLLGYSAALDCFLRPHDPAHLPIGIESRLVSWPVYLVACSWFGGFAVGFLSVMGLMGVSIFICLAYLLQIVRCELQMGCAFYKTEPILRWNPHQLLVTWRALEILGRMFNVEMGFLLLYMQACFTCVFLFAMCTLFYQWNVLHVSTRMLLVSCAIMVVIPWCIFLNLAGLAYQWSKETLVSWKSEYWPSNKDWQYVKKVKRACMPLCVGDGKRFIVRPVTVLNFLRCVSKNTFRAIVTYGEILGNT